MKRFRPRLATVAAALLVSALVVVVNPTSASACVADPDGDCYLSVQGTVSSANLNVRAAPWGTVIDNLPNGYANRVDCYVRATDGSYWDWLYDSHIGRAGWVYDPYLYTGGNVYDQVDEMHEGHCGSLPLMAPTNVQAVAVSSSRIHVSWTDVNLATASYVVSNGNVSSADLPPGTTGYDWGGLAPGTYMCFTLTAKKGGTQTPWTPYACATTLGLNTPTNVTAVATYGSVVHVSWTDPTRGGAQFIVGNGDTVSPTLPAGTTGYDWTGIAPGTYMCFHVLAVQSGSESPWSPYACLTTPSYVNIGDSFSSGEGTYPPYLGGSDTTTDRCHRSDQSYSGQFAASSQHWKKVTVTIACSGGVTNDIVNPISGPTNEMGIPAQGEPAQTSKLNAGTGLVTLTIGGNNLNLAGIFTTCMKLLDHDQTDRCFRETYFNDDFIASIPTQLAAGNRYGQGLADTYAAVKAAAPHAKIVVSTYPQIFPAQYTGDYAEAAFWPTTWLYVITSQDQLNRIRRVVHAMNDAIRATAAQYGFTVVEMEDVFAGHEVNQGDQRWVNDVQGFSVTNQNANNESLHPNQTGYQHWAAKVKEKLG